MPKITNQYALAALACFGGLLFGFDISSMSLILDLESYNRTFGSYDEKSGAVKVDATLQGGISASMAGGSAIGAIVSGLLSDRLGRKGAIFVACAIWLVGSILASAAQNVGMLIVARITCGVCVGIASAQVPVYLSELANPKIRGRLVGCQQWAITIGIALFYYVSLGCSKIQTGDNTAQFRVPWALQMVPAIILMLLIPLMPESPRWLATKNRWEDSLQVLADVHAKGDTNDALVLAEFKEIQTAVEEENTSSYGELFGPRYLNRLHIVVFTQIWSQLTGMNVMMYYISYVFQMAGFTGDAALVSQSIQYVINVVMTIPALIFLDRWGRRPTLLIGSSLMAIWMFANAGILANNGAYYEPQGNDPDAVHWKIFADRKSAATGLIACTYLFVASFAPTWGPVSWVYPPELFPSRLRAKSNSISTVSNWLFNFALGYFTPPAFKNIQWRTYLIFGIFNVLMTIHVFVAFPETKGLTLEEVEDVFATHTPAWKTRAITQQNKLASIADRIEKGGDPDTAAKEALGYTAEPSATADNASDEKKDVA